MRWRRLDAAAHGVGMGHVAVVIWHLAFGSWHLALRIRR